MGQLSTAAVAAGGAALARREGIDSVGVRAVAAELEVTPMALYRHVVDASDLHALVVDQLLDGFPQVVANGAWDERCRRWAYDARAVLVRAPGLARHVLLHWTGLPPALEAVDGLGTMFEREGPPGIDAVAAANTVFTYVLMRAQAEEAVRTHAVVRDLHVLREHRKDLPFLWRHRAEYVAAKVDAHFAYGLDVLLAGLAAAPRRGARRRARS